MSGDAKRVARHLDRATELARLMDETIALAGPLHHGDDLEGEQYRDMIRTYAAAAQVHVALAGALSQVPAVCTPCEDGFHESCWAPCGCVCR